MKFSAITFAGAGSFGLKPSYHASVPGMGQRRLREE
jgi:hypothetical protein